MIPKTIIPLTVCLTCFITFSFAQRNIPQQRSLAADKISFTENVGQFTGLETRTTATDVLFKLSSPKGELYITTRGLSYVFSRLLTPLQPDSNQANHHVPAIRRYDIERVDISLENSAIRRDHAEITYESASPATNYYLRTGYRQSRPISSVTIRDVYPGIDWVIYIDHTHGAAHVQQDFVLRPGATLRHIQFRYSGNARLHIDSSGKITTTGKMGKITENAPLARVSGDTTIVPVRVVQHHNRLSYELPDPVIRHTTVIDPELYWGTALTSDVTGIDYNDAVEGNDVESDDNGNIYVLLSITKGVSFPTLDPGNGAYYQDYAATPDAGMEIMKFDKGGVLLWSTFFGQITNGVTLAVDPSGNLYAAGLQSPGGSIPILSNGGYLDGTSDNNFIAKFTPTGQLLWSSYWAGIQVTVTRMVCDSKGNLYMTGVDGGPIPLKDAGGGDYYVTTDYAAQAPFIAEFSSSTQLLWSTLIKGMAYLNSSERLTVDLYDNLYQCGDSVRCFNTSHQETWADATVGWPFLADIACDRQGDVYVVGSGPGTIVKTDPGNGAFIDNTPSSGFSTGFIIKYDNSTHQIVWSTPFFNEAMTDIGRIVADKRCDAMHLLGVMNSFPPLIPTVDNSCYGDFYFSSSQIVTTTAPVFVTFTTGGQLIYCSLTNWPYNYYTIGMSMTADPFGGLTYLFGQVFNYSNIPAINNPGNGAFIQTGSNNLLYSAFLMKLVPSKLNVTLAITNPVDCHCTGTAAANIVCGTAPYSFLWSTGAATQAVTGLCNGNYSVIVTDANCNDTTFLFTVAPPPGGVTGFASAVDNSHCSLNDGAISIAGVQGGTAPYTYALNGQPVQNNGDFSSLPPGTYQVAVTDINGCFYNDSVQVNFVPGPDSIYFTTSLASCNRSDAVLTIDSVGAGTTPFQFSLNTGAFTPTEALDNLAAGNYYIQVRDSAGCLKGDSIAIASHLPPSGLTTNLISAHCDSTDGALNIGVITGGTSPYTYSLDGNTSRSTPGFNSLSPGSHILNVLDSANCLFRDTIFIANIPGPSAVSLTINDALCGATYGNISIRSVTGGTSPIGYSLDSLQFVAGTAFDSLAPGIYVLYVRDSAGCSLRDSFNIVATSKTPITVYPADTAICFGTDITFTVVPGNGPQLTTYSWNGGSGTQSSLSLTAEQAGYIILTATNNQNCASVDTAILEIKDCDSLASTCVRFPNAFTPNNDGHNDLFGAVAHCPITSYKIMIFDRFGQLVFTSNDINVKWDGTINGTPQPSGNYVYVCEYSIGPAHETRSGFVILVR